ncbi:MAG: efflux RND transporter periplasmic adaptor subunit [Holosporales bacterium]|jgi:HlyD family secretion protein|nr:efflux RND transporter periplasmic adaptor subunit [Holosporales bacterium]
MNKFLKILIGFIGVIAVLIVVYKQFFSSETEIVLNGNVEIQDVKVSSRIQGRIKEVLVEEGDKVNKDQTLAILDTDILDAQVQLALAELTEASINFGNCTKDFNRNKELYKKHSISEKIYDDIKGKYEVAQAKKEGAMAKYNLAIISKKDAVIKSPIQGTVITRNIENGEMINVSSPAFSIMPDTQKRIKIYANAEILQHIKLGDKVIIESDSTKSKSFNGHIAFISSESEFTPKNIETEELRTSLVYRIRVIVDDIEREKELKHGMSVSVHLSQNKK